MHLLYRHWSRLIQNQNRTQVRCLQRIEAGKVSRSARDEMTKQAESSKYNSLRGDGDNSVLDGTTLPHAVNIDKMI